MFRDKEYVYEVYRELSFSKAASRLYISQPSLSAKIKQIEEKLGETIFDRSTSPLRLTEFGKKYIEAIEEVKRIEKRVEGFALDLNGLHSGELSVGASNVFSAYVLPPVIAKFKERFPNVNIRLVEGNTASLEEQLSKNELDVVIDNNHYDKELYEKINYTSELILLAVPKDFPECKLAKDYEISEEAILNKSYLDPAYPTVPLSIFKSSPFVLLRANNDTRTRAERMCREAGFRPTVALEVEQQATAYMICATKVGASFVSDTLVGKLPSFENLAYYKLSSPHAFRKVSFTLKKYKQKTRATEEFIKLISEK